MERRIRTTTTMLRSIAVALFVCSACLLLTAVQSFTLGDPSTTRRTRSILQATSSFQKTPDTNGEILDEIPAAFEPLFSSAANATTPQGADVRFEWGTWVVDASIDNLMERVDEIRLKNAVFDEFIINNGDDSSDNVAPRRLRVANGTNWDCILHFLPAGSEWKGRWPTGSWAVVKTLIGMAEIAALSGPDRDGRYRKRTSKDLRGGGDGSLAGGKSSAGVDCIKYVGGPLRSYTGKSGKTVVLEVVIKPPIGDAKPEQIESLGDIENTLDVYIPEPEPEPTDEDASPVDASASTKTNGTKHLGAAMGMEFDEVGGLDAQLDSIARRVLASRANPAAARRLGVSHVRGILLSGPPGCGKTLLARELAHILGAREPQIVNGPEILDKFIGEAEKKVRDLFLPAEQEYKESGDDSALHIIILDEMDAIARKRGSMSSDTTGVRDSVVNQLLAKMDGVKQASNVLVVGLTNRPELLDPALLRPGRLEVQLRIELPDQLGRRDIIRIHTRRMREAGGMSTAAVESIDDEGEHGLAARTDHFSGAELAGLVRSAASFALARALEPDNEEDEGVVNVSDLEKALGEVRPALGKQDEVLKMRYPLGISDYSSPMSRILRDLERFTSPIVSAAPRFQSLLLVGGGGVGGAGATALAAYAATGASSNGSADFVRFITALDLLSGEGGGGEEARAGALVERFAEAREMSHSLLVLDDVDQLCAGSGPGGYSSIMLATLRALLRSPPASSSTAKAGGQSESKRKGGKSISVIAATSRSDAACDSLHELFDETIVIPLLSQSEDVHKLLHDSLPPGTLTSVDRVSNMIIERLGSVGCKTALRLAERAASTAGPGQDEVGDEAQQLSTLSEMLDDLAGDTMAALETR